MLWVAIEPQALDHRPLEVADEPIGQEERAGSAVGNLVESRLARVHLVAVRAAQAGRPNLFQQRVELAVHPALPVDDDELVVARAKCMQPLPELVDDSRRVEMEQRGHAVDVDFPTTPVDDVLHLAAKGAADDQRSRVHRTAANWGNPSTPMNESLKSGRPDSSTYSMRDRSSNATWRSR